MAKNILINVVIALAILKVSLSTGPEIMLAKHSLAVPRYGQAEESSYSKNKFLATSSRFPLPIYCHSFAHREQQDA